MSRFLSEFRILRKPSQKGFTLVEILISSTIFLLVMGVTLSFIFDFSRTGNKTILQATLDEQMRNSLNRLEREITDASAVLVDDGSGTTTDKDTVVLSVPLYNSLGFVVVDAGVPLFDTLVVSVETDDTADTLTLRNSGVSTSSSPDKLVFSLDPDTVGGSTRQAISNQVIARDLMPKSGGNYLTWDNQVSTDVTFKYLDKDGSETATHADMAQVQVLLRAAKDYSGGLVMVEKELLIRLRNWSN